MGACKSLVREEDEDDKERRLAFEEHKKEMNDFRKQLKRQRAQFSELDLSGKAIKSKKNPLEQSPNPSPDPTPEQIIKASNIIYDA